MEDDMEIEEVFVVHEVDLDYEYDAPRCFDFTREETPAEAREVERWFEFAKSYPPSPFVVKLLLGDHIMMETINVSPKSKESNAQVVNSECDNGLGDHQAIQANGTDCKGMAKGIFCKLQSASLCEVQNQPVRSSKGSRFQNHISSDKAKTKINKDKPRSSTLMKPTASILAKQYQPSQVIGSRLQMPPGQVVRTTTLFTIGSETQATKRQKLEGGHICKTMEPKQPVSLIHKAPRKDGSENTSHARLKLTIPREPDLETAQRAQRMRPKSNNQVEDLMVPVRRFKARPLNRKILDAPQLPLPQKSTPRLPEFQLFHLKTLERAMQHSSSSAASSSSLTHCDDFSKGLFKVNSVSVAETESKGAGRKSTVDMQMQDRSQFLFKAHPLNKKILSSKGDMGIFRNEKRGTTVPIEFKLQSGNMVQQIPPTELFSKLSLSSELRPNNGSHTQLKLPQPTSTTLKGFKENRFSSLPQKNEIIHPEKEKPTIYGGRQFQQNRDGVPTEVGAKLSMRSSSIR